MMLLITPRSIREASAPSHTVSRRAVISVAAGLALTGALPTVPTLVMQGDDDQIVPYKDASLLQAKLLKHGTLKIYPGYPHGMLTTNAEVINADLLAFIKS